MSRHVLRSAVALVGCFLILGFPLAARAELIEDDVLGHHVGLAYGPGTARLDGMGLTIAARDENNEINLFDFGDNPAGFLPDRDAWSVDSRFTHRERVERDPRLSGFEYKSNAYTFLTGYRRAGLQAIGGGVDYVESWVRTRGQPRKSYADTQYRLLYGQKFGKLGLGMEFRYLHEAEDLSGLSLVYPITHTTRAGAGILGVSYAIGNYVQVAARGDIRRATVDGISLSNVHEDDFNWRRPNGSGDAQVYVNHPRLQGGVVYGRRKGAGEEKVTVGWSPLFIFNPSTAYVRFEKPTFTEELKTDYFRTRWELDLVPDRVMVAAAYNKDQRSQDIRTVPVVIGSRSPLSSRFDTSQLGLGGSWMAFNQRLSLGAEFYHDEQTYEDKDRLGGYTQEEKATSFGLGGEFLALEDLAVRSGLTFRSEKRSETSVNPARVPGVTGTFDATTASFGLGLVPSGGILQLDAAYLVDVSSQLSITRNQFSLYARLLF